MSKLIRGSWLGILSTLLLFGDVYAHVEGEQYTETGIWRATFIISCGIFVIILLGALLEKFGLPKRIEWSLKGLVTLGVIATLFWYVWHYLIH